eukprot:6441797-Prymnesium_polylepis.1
MTCPQRAPAASSTDVALAWPPRRAFAHADSPRSHRDSSSAPASMSACSTRPEPQRAASMSAVRPLASRPLRHPKPPVDNNNAITTAC